MSRVLDPLAVLALILASVVFVVRHVPGHHEISPVDEYMYIDYYAKVQDQGLVRQGEKTGDFARRYSSCHPNRVFGEWLPELCPKSAPRPDVSYPFEGATWADLYTPLYFVSVRVIAEPLIWSGVEFVEAGRLAGGVWLALGVVLLYLALRRMQVSRSIAFAAGLCIAGSLPAYWSNTYLSTDATALAAGSTMLYLAVMLAERPTRWRAAALVVAGALAAAFKIQNLSAVVVVGAFLLLQSLWDARAGESGAIPVLKRWLMDRRSQAAIGALVAGVLVQAVWLTIRATLSTGGDVDQGVDGPFVFPAHLLLDMLAFFPGTAEGSFASPEVGPWGDISFRAVTLVIVGGVIGLLCARGVDARGRSLAIAVLFTSLVAGPALSLATMVMTDLYIPLVSRYGTSIFPAMVACGALLVPQDSRWARWGAVLWGAFIFSVGLAFTQ